MNHDDTFRLVLVLGFVVLFPIGLYHRIRSQMTGESLDRRQEGWFILLTLRPLAFACMAGLVAWLINPSWMAWSSVDLPLWMRWGGVAVGVAGGGLLVWTFRSIGTNITDTVVTRKEHQLVTHGPYRWVRHPFYVSMASCLLANALVAANWYILLTGGLLMGLIVLRTRTEEDRLLARFGDSYRVYMERTGRFFPRFGAR